MTPTPEQIEAAARTFSSSSWNTLSPQDQHRFREKAISALTAAAGVGVSKGGIGAFPEDDPRPGAFHAAAGAGEPKTNEVTCIEKIINDTIERCAQVADHYAEIHSNPDLIAMAASIAAFIRALKDKP